MLSIFSFVNGLLTSPAMLSSSRWLTLRASIVVGEHDDNRGVGHAEVGSLEMARDPEVRALRTANKRLAQELDILKKALIFQML